MKHVVFDHVSPTGVISRSTLLIATEAEWSAAPEAASPAFAAWTDPADGLVYALATGAARATLGAEGDRRQIASSN